MMKQYNGFKSEASGGSYPMLPAGPYVCEVKGVKIEGAEPDQVLILRLDITEGEFAGYYTKRYQHDTANNVGSNFPVKYKGDFRIQIPNEANTKRTHPEWDIKAFNNMVWCMEQSNEGYRWNWDENTLKGKTVGINVRAGTYNGNPYTQIGRLEVAGDVRKGLVKTMKPKADSGSSATEAGAAVPAGFVPVEDEIPF